MGTLHHRAVIKAFNKGDFFAHINDIGFPWGTDWQDDERVMKIINDLKKRYDIVKVDVRDAG